MRGGGEGLADVMQDAVRPSEKHKHIFFSNTNLRLKNIQVFFIEASGNENYYIIARLLLVGLADVMQDTVGLNLY